ncbi:hypothetical protein PG988_016231 [Apiospora saccharicola]
MCNSESAADAFFAKAIFGLFNLFFWMPWVITALAFAFWLAPLAYITVLGVLIGAFGLYRSGHYTTNSLRPCVRISSAEESRHHHQTDHHSQDTKMGAIHVKRVTNQTKDTILGGRICAGQS